VRVKCGKKPERKIITLNREILLWEDNINIVLGKVGCYLLPTGSGTW
jgi:hypothetical protein